MTVLYITKYHSFAVCGNYREGWLYRHESGSKSWAMDVREVVAGTGEEDWPFLREWDHEDWDERFRLAKSYADRQERKLGKIERQLT